MKKGIRRYVICSVFALLLIGCGTKSESMRDFKAAATSEISETMDKKNDTKAVRVLKEQEAEDDFIQWQEVTLKLPAKWRNLYVTEESADHISFFQKSSYEQAESMGLLFGILRSKKPLYDMPGAEPLAYTEKNMYYIVTVFCLPSRTGCFWIFQCMRRWTKVPYRRR